MVELFFFRNNESTSNVNDIRLRTDYLWYQSVNKI